MLDEPTSGLDPIVRREFIQTIIGAYQDGEPGRRTVFVSTHLISEFEGLIDEFTIIEQGRDVLTLTADAARERYQKIYARFATEPAGLDLAGARVLRRRGRATSRSSSTATRPTCWSGCEARSPETLTTEALTLEEIFVATLQPEACRVMLTAYCRCVAKEVRALLPPWLGCMALVWLPARSAVTASSRPYFESWCSSSAEPRRARRAVDRPRVHRTDAGVDALRSRSSRARVLAVKTARPGGDAAALAVSSLWATVLLVSSETRRSAVVLSRCCAACASRRG